MTHAAISHQMRNLEEWFGAPLMVRQGRGVRLTAPGEALARHMMPIFEQMEAVCERVRRTTRGGHLTVGCIPSIAARWLVPRLREFTERHPETGISVVYASADDRLTDTAHDVLITYGEIEEKGTEAVRLFSRINKPVCSPGFLAARGPFTDAAAIAKAPLLHDEHRADWRAWFQSAGLSPEAANSGPVYQDFNLLATAVIAGHGIGLCPVEVIRQEIEAGDLVVLSDISTNPENAYFVRRRTDSGPLAEAFITWFLESTRAQTLVR